MVILPCGLLMLYDKPESVFKGYVCHIRIGHLILERLTEIQHFKIEYATICPKQTQKKLAKLLMLQKIKRLRPILEQRFDTSIDNIRTINNAGRTATPKGIGKHEKQNNIK